MSAEISGSCVLYLFIDESGNFDFSTRGTKYFVLSCLATFEPVTQRDEFLSLRYKLLDRGMNQEYFHATEDAQAVRDGMFAILTRLKNTFEIHSIIAQKNKANPTLYFEEHQKHGRLIRRNIGARFYEVVCRTLLQYVFNRPAFKDAARIVVVLGAVFTSDKQSLVLRTLKRYLKEQCPIKSFEIYFHQAKADINCQIADYCGWAIAIRWEREEIRPYKLIADVVKSQYEIFKSGDREYY